MKQKENRDRIIAIAALAIGLVATLLISSAVSFAETCGPIRNGVLRLHILANSDSDEDQRLKLAVRDRVLTLDLFSSGQYGLYGSYGYQTSTIRHRTIPEKDFPYYCVW